MVYRNASLLLGREIADPVVIQDARPKRYIAVSISVDVTRDGGSVLGQEAANRPPHPNLHSFGW